MDEQIVDTNWIDVLNMGMDDADFGRFVANMRLLRTIYKFMGIVGSLIAASAGGLIGLWIADIMPNVVWLSIILLLVAYPVVSSMRFKMDLQFGPSFFHEPDLPDKLEIYWRLSRAEKNDNYS